MHCGGKIAPNASYCPNCGAQQALPPSATPAGQPATQSVDPLPEGIKGWSWGAFWLSWIWAIFNKTWIGLLALIPVVNLVMAVVLGIKGREWAWRNQTWTSLEHFNRVQKNWNIAGWIVAALGLMLGIAVAMVEERTSPKGGDVDAPWTQAQPANHEARAERGPERATAPTDSPYPLPTLSYPKTELLHALRRMGMEDPWVHRFTLYLAQPENFWKECVAQEAGRAQTLGNMPAQAAEMHGRAVCLGEVQLYHDCLDGKPLDDGALCLQAHVNEVAENGD